MLSKEQIIDAISTQFNVKKEIIFAKRRGNIYRKLALYLLENYSELSLNQIGELFNMEYAAVSQAVRRFENEIKKNKIASEMRNIMITTLKQKGNVEC